MGLKLGTVKTVKNVIFLIKHFFKKITVLTVLYLTLYPCVELKLVLITRGKKRALKLKNSV
jgi:hypothetical protein